MPREDRLTRLLNRSEVADLVDVPALVPLLEEAFRAHSAGELIHGQRFFSRLPGPGSSMILAPGIAPGVPAYSVKVHSKFPASPPGIKGVLLLNDLQDGRLLAILDSTYLTAVRTGLSAAIATHRLARSAAGRVAVVGAGVQGEFQLRYLATLRELESVRVFDARPQQTQRYVERLGAELAVPVQGSEDIAGAVADADIVLMATWASEPILYLDMLRPGCHVTTLGADQPHEAEVDAALIRQGLFVCDDRELAVRQGAVGGVNLGPEAIDAELGEIIAGRHPGRTGADEISVYGAVGLAFQDVVVAWQVYDSALRNDVGQDLAFLA
ncbi:ornithine cyclodeaminase family protein [Ectothiorhodospiraceae bacterium WFHF3C12]|nr:ornithine cyclodeaminase family protein [Ectothiorhodospiraceae bacterium WFHF3C12]